MKKLALVTLMGLSLGAVSLPTFAATQPGNTTGTVTFTGIITKPTVNYGVPTTGTGSPASTGGNGQAAGTYTLNGNNLIFDYGTGTFKQLQNIGFSFSIAPLTSSGAAMSTAEAAAEGLTISRIEWSGNGVSSNNNTITLKSTGAGADNNLQVTMTGTPLQNNYAYSYKAVLSKVNPQQPAKVGGFNMNSTYVVSYN